MAVGLRCGGLVTISEGNTERPANMDRRPTFDLILNRTDPFTIDVSDPAPTGFAPDSGKSVCSEQCDIGHMLITGFEPRRPRDYGKFVRRERLGEARFN